MSNTDRYSPAKQSPGTGFITYPLPLLFGLTLKMMVSFDEE